MLETEYQEFLNNQIEGFEKNLGVVSRLHDLLKLEDEQVRELFVIAWYEAYEKGMPLFIIEEFIKAGVYCAESAGVIWASHVALGRHVDFARLTRGWGKMFCDGSLTWEQTIAVKLGWILNEGVL